MKVICPNCGKKLKNNIIKGMVISKDLFVNIKNLKNYKIVLYEDGIIGKVNDFIYKGFDCWLCSNCGMVISFDMGDYLLQKWSHS
jgi:hypothetical protein